MKKHILVALLFLLATSSALAASTVTRLTVDLDGQVMVNNSDNPRKLDPGFAVGADLIFTKTPSAQLGLGVEYQKERPWSSSRTIQFIPIYGFVNYHGTSSSWRRGTQPYFSGRFGYSLFNGPYSESSNIKAEGGLYYSLGVGINFQDQFRIEANYASASGQEMSSFTKTEYTYNRTTVSFGIVF
jgi:opacity protein-like surface antigen